jgi:hypothetical protein
MGGGAWRDDLEHVPGSVGAQASSRERDTSGIV